MTLPLIKGFESTWKGPASANTPGAVASEFSNYGSDPIDIDYADIKVAVYDTPPYEGQAFVLFRDTRDGKFYEVNASHCSCYGLEDQWQPEEVVVAEIVKRPRYLYSDDAMINGLIRVAVIEALEGVTQ